MWLFFPFLVGLSLSLTLFSLCLTVVLVDIKNTAVAQLHVAVKHAQLAEIQSAALKTERAAEEKAIKTASLPWSVKNDRLEASYENEALDKATNPEYYSQVEGLGR